MVTSAFVTRSGSPGSASVWVGDIILLR